MNLERIFSTNDVKSQDRFGLWREICEDRLVPMDQSRLNDQAFDAVIEGTSVGGMSFTQFGLSNLKCATNSRTIRHQNNRTDKLFLSLVLSGTVSSEQNGHSTTDRPGDLSIRDTNSPWRIEHGNRSDVLAIEIPRDRLENQLGAARHFAGLTMDGSRPVTILARSYFRNLMSVGHRLTPHAAERMTSIGIDLVAASLAERMALETPKALHGTLTVQRAKAYVATHLGDPGLDVLQVAVAVGVSLRQLQALFREHGRNVTAWIWHQRLERAAQRLSDPACLHVQLGELAHGCGFASQAHFSRRFRDRYGLSPRDYRHSALSQTAARMS
ncbi:helix-turn-helix domain-containing protein [Methylobacterium sp. Leaf112]|uniref:AraC-like ligand-binding domain-containing protein n=1 Tax=Methylobacterium sp. Leaf112 TaxID=1736258 RepID=UPI0009EA790F|nr:helix-turn-helix domain-containing protein [Methylobacterium sp. Leaf112]